MFTVSFKNPHQFKKIIESINNLVSEACFLFSADGLKCQAMDSSHISLIVIELSAEKHFSLYEIEDDVLVGLSVSSLLKILKCVDSKFDLTISQKTDSDVLDIILKSLDRKLDFKLKLMDIECESMEIPEQEYQAKVQLDSAEFYRSMKDLSNFGDVCTITCSEESKNGIVFSAEGEMGVADFEFSNISSELAESISLKFSTRYLVLFAQAASVNKSFLVKLSSDAPLVLDYDEIKFFLAPKIEDEE